MESQSSSTGSEWVGYLYMRTCGRRKVWDMAQNWLVLIRRSLTVHPAGRAAGTAVRLVWRVLGPPHSLLRWGAP